MKDHLNLPNLKHLNLAGNHLTTVNTDMFANMPKLQYLYLAQNILDTVSLPNSHLVHVDLNNNLLKFMDNIAVNFQTSISSFGQLTELVCNFCNIHLIMPYFIYDTSPTMESLSLRSNLLRSVGFFNSRQGDLNLISIDLTYNNIRHIDRTDFAKLPKVINLYLGSNEIASIAPGAFESMAMLHILDLSNNFIFELPPNGFDQVPLVWLLLNGNNMAFFPIPGWQNVSVKISKNNSKLNSLQLLNIENNPFQCDCLESIHMWARDNSIELKVYDTKVKAGVKPACIVNDQGCETNVGKDFIRGYWHLFNDNKIKDIIQLEDE
uniref:Putative insulin-like growth factor-binding protein complex acid labile subunit n=1 Tax=Lutzomyia longipalpis TaxID=7200 RepID=A0A1B0CBX8_LUTLO